ncbi:hypothetical protein NHX12_008072, partial [Muraenolepis orangiensis]
METMELQVLELDRLAKGEEESQGHVKMFQMSTRTSGFRLLLVFLFLVSCVTYYCSHTILQSYNGTNMSPNSSTSLCGWLTQRRWESLKLNISRQTDLFLKLGDFFWREHLSPQALPYGIKGSGRSALASSSCRPRPPVGLILLLNDAPVRGYQEDVGTRTTMRFFYPESATYDPATHNNPDTLMVLVPFKHQDLRWLHAIVNNQKRVQTGFWKRPPLIWLGDTSKMRVLDPHYMHQTAERLLQIPRLPKGAEPVHPTTGILAVFVALNFCDVVHIAGFGYPRSKPPNHPIHYYGYATSTSMKNSQHNTYNEAQTLKRLEDLGAIGQLNPFLDANVSIILSLEILFPDSGVQ